MKFKIIPNEQTPKVITNISPDVFIFNNNKLINKFLSFASRQHNCVGLASNQVAIDGSRIIVPFFAIKDIHFWDVVIYPEITKYIGKPEIKIEGCLTWLGKKIRAERYPQIEVTYYNIFGKKIEEEISGFKSQIWQHEYNHLMGVNEVVLNAI